MFLGGAGLADTMLYCRDKIYPLGLPNGIAHGLTAFALLAKLFLKMKASFLPPDPRPLNVSLRQEENMISGRFSLLAVTTLEKLLLSSDVGGKAGDSQAAGDRGTADVADPRARGEHCGQPWPDIAAGGSLPARGRDHDRGRKLQRDP